MVSEPHSWERCALPSKMVKAHGGHWRPHLIDADFYDTRTAAAIMEQRLGK